MGRGILLEQRYGKVLEVVVKLSWLDGKIIKSFGSTEALKQAVTTIVFYVAIG